MERTIPEIADKLGIDKGRIYRLLKKVDIKPVRTEPKKVFGEPEQTLIEQYLSDEFSSERTETNQNERTANSKRTETNQKRTETENKDKIIDALIEQLRQKDKQIDNLGTLLSQQQQLTLQDKETIKNQAKQIESFSVRTEPKRTEPNEPRTQNELKSKFWDFFKNKKNNTKK